MIKKFIYVILTFSSIILIITLINSSILSKSDEFIKKDLNDLPNAEVALILGSKVFANNKLSDILEDRTLKAIELYNNGKVAKLLVSGDHGDKSYDEVNAVKLYLLDHGVSESDIFLDHAGFDTYDSMYRARDVFLVRDLIIVTQEFHLPRAIYLARELGLEANGYVADRNLYVLSRRNNFREVFARVKAWINIMVGSSPTFLGDPIPIYGDGRFSWD